MHRRETYDLEHRSVVVESLLERCDYLGKWSDKTNSLSVWTCQEGYFRGLRKERKNL